MFDGRTTNYKNFNTGKGKRNKNREKLIKPMALFFRVLRFHNYLTSTLQKVQS